jgi:2-polyprenyl-3-methyl-5-hydroxy-6-metoxy-1,4-benzoquinol methylase
MTIKNKDLENFYDRVYRKGEKKHYTKLITQGKLKLTFEKNEILNSISWKNKRVLDIGCGTGELAYLLSQQGTKSVIGVDFSREAIDRATESYSRENLSYLRADVSSVKGIFDVILLVGTLEHVDDPLSFLRWAKKKLAPGGSIIVTCPNWSNPRGYILLTLKELFGLKITLADIHYFTPVEFQGFSKKLNMKLVWKTFEQEWAHGDKMINDFKKRLPNIFADVPQKEHTARIQAFITWLDTHVIPLEGNQESSGAVGFYRLTK